MREESNMTEVFGSKTRLTLLGMFAALIAASALTVLSGSIREAEAGHVGAVPNWNHGPAGATGHGINPATRPEEFHNRAIASNEANDHRIRLLAVNHSLPPMDPGT